MLPVRTGLADIDAICAYLITKSGGASPAELINDKAVDRRQLAALKFWGLIEDADAKFRLSERGLLVARDKGANRAAALRQAVAAVAPYGSIIARAVHLQKTTILSTEVAAHWHQHFRTEAHFGILNQQTVCFFRVAEGADLGHLIVGRKGQQTRFELAEDDARAFVLSANFVHSLASAESAPTRIHGGLKPEPTPRRGNRVFVTHRMNKKIVERVKELVAFGQFDPVVPQDCETKKPFPDDVMDEMRRCDTAVIRVDFDGLLFDLGRNEEPRISEDIMIEIGAAIALFGRKFILLVEEGITLPENLQGLCVCRYSGEELDMPATMTLLKAFNDFTRSHPRGAVAVALVADHVGATGLQYERLGTSVHARN